MEKVDIAIIGAGVIGLAIERELSKSHQNVVVLEKNPKFGQETSSRNSEVIHSGIYYPSQLANLLFPQKTSKYQKSKKSHNTSGKYYQSFTHKYTPLLHNLLLLWPIYLI
jgi:L-2-hydroxyglutarate oxidase LhgO